MNSIVRIFVVENEGHIRRKFAEIKVHEAGKLGQTAFPVDGFAVSVVLGLCFFEGSTENGCYLNEWLDFRRI